MKHRTLDSKDFNAIEEEIPFSEKGALKAYKTKEHLAWVNTALDVFGSEAGSTGIVYESLLMMENLSFQLFSKKCEHREIEKAKEKEPDEVLIDTREYSSSLSIDQCSKEKIHKIIKVYKDGISYAAGKISAKIAKHFAGDNVPELFFDEFAETTEQFVDSVIEMLPEPPEIVRPMMLFAQIYAIKAGIPGPISLSALTSGKNVRDFSVGKYKDFLSGETSVIGDTVLMDLNKRLLEHILDALNRDIDNFSEKAFSTLLNKNEFLGDVERNPDTSLAKKDLLFGMVALSQVYEAKIGQIESLMNYPVQARVPVLVSIPSRKKGNPSPSP